MEMRRSVGRSGERGAQRCGYVASKIYAQRSSAIAGTFSDQRSWYILSRLSMIESCRLSDLNSNRQNVL